MILVIISNSTNIWSVWAHTVAPIFTIFFTSFNIQLFTCIVCISAHDTYIHTYLHICNTYFGIEYLGIVKYFCLSMRKAFRLSRLVGWEQIMFTFTLSLFSKDKYLQSASVRYKRAWSSYNNNSIFFMFSSQHSNHAKHLNDRISWIWILMLDCRPMTFGFHFCSVVFCVATVV